MELYGYIKYKNTLKRGQDIQYYFESGRLFNMIVNSSFDDIYIGDYFRESYCGRTNKFRIAKFIGSEDAFTRPQIIIVPDEPLLEDRMNSTPTSLGGYSNSDMYSKVIGLPTIKPGTETVNQNLYRMFGRHFIATQELLSPTIDKDKLVIDGTTSWEYPKGVDRYPCQAILMSEQEVFGANILGNAQTSEEQLPLFLLMPELKNTNKKWYWFRNAAGIDKFCHCNYKGDPASCLATYKNGVRPRFSLG